jgi:nicotinate phosphoribosyltransferase
MKGPIAQCQLVETPLLNIINFQTLIATKSARICRAARGEPVLEFGLRRAQGIDGGLAASRAAYIGGCAGTSNVLAGRLFDIPVRGTHAHSWVMCFDSELESFQQYARAMPNNCVFLVDTYDTIEGVRKAVTVGHWLRERGHEMVGIRLDSGDLAELSIESRRILDEAGFADAAIVASNDLDEYRVERLKERGATINVWGIGTRMVTAYQQPALGGVYKLAAIREPGQPWSYKVKLSEQPIKVSNPGIQQVRRFFRDDRALADAIYDVELGIGEPCTLIDPMDASDQTPIAAGTPFEDLLVPVFEGGRRVYVGPALGELRTRCLDQMTRLAEPYRRLSEPDEYPVGLEANLHALKARLMAEAAEG